MPEEKAPTPNHDQLITEWVFRRTYEDLAERVSDPSFQTRYRLLGTAGLLRKLLLDGGSSLVSQANRTHKLPLTFRVHKFDLDAGPVPEIAKARGTTQEAWQNGLRFHGGASVPGKDRTTVLKLSRDAWIRHVTGQCAGETISVKELILFCAHVEGGVHAGKPKSRSEKEMRSFTHSFLSPETPQQILMMSPIGSLYWISKVTLVGLRDLYDVTTG